MDWTFLPTLTTISTAMRCTMPLLSDFSAPPPLHSILGIFLGIFYNNSTIGLESDDTATYCMSRTMLNEPEVQPLPSETLKAFGNDAFRARIFDEKYALRGADGAVLEHLPAQMWRRVAQGIAAVEAPEKQREWEDKFAWLLSNFRMVPGGRILHAIGNPNNVTALNCYVVPAPHDSLQGIYHTAWELAETFKRGGGCGVDLSSLRPKDAPVHNASRVSTGATSFMELYSVTTGIIGQGGRRGALML